MGFLKNILKTIGDPNSFTRIKGVGAYELGRRHALSGVTRIPPSNPNLKDDYHRGYEDGMKEKMIDAMNKKNT